MESSRQIEARAAQWLAKQDSGEWLPADDAELQEWLAVAVHRVAYIRLRAAWNKTQRLQALGAGIPRGTVPRVGAWRGSRFFGPDEPGDVPPRTESKPIGDIAPVKRHGLFALAASVLLAFGAVAAYYFPRPGSAYTTPIGGLASVPMSDGSRVILNTNSQIRFALTDNERDVELRQGEAYFEVAHDPARPFIVRAADKRIVAVGTNFSVRRDGELVRVIVTEGKVRVEPNESADAGSGVTADARGASISSATIYLTAGGIARSSGAGTIAEERPLPEVEEYLSWRTGYVVFHESQLGDAVAELNRYNTRKIVIADPEVATMKLSGNFRATNIEGFVRLLEEGFPITARTRDGTIVLMKN